MLNQDYSDRLFEDLSSASKTPIEINSKFKKYSRLKDLSKPKLRPAYDFEEIIGPNSYHPKFDFLSTKSKSPTVAIGRSERFIRKKLPELYEKMLKHSTERKNQVYINSDIPTPPSYTFKRTGHKLNLVENPGFPGAGRYTPIKDYSIKSYSFGKAKKNFNWKNGKKYVAALGNLM